MIRALIWKEYREHRAIWLTLAVVGGAGLFGLSQLMAPDGFLGSTGARESLQSVAVLFAWTYGLVCGSMLLASEHEAGTMTFLDILPVRRRELWLVKSLFGLVLLLTQVAVLAGFVVGLDIVETTPEILLTLLAMSIFGLIALSWSLLFSAIGDNVLNVIGLSFLGQIAGGFLALILIVPVIFVMGMLGSWRLIDSEHARLCLICIGVFGLIVIPILGSARLYTRLDRRRARSLRWMSRKPVDMNGWISWGRLLWLSYMQMRRLLVVLILSSLILGFLLLVLGPAAWPALTLLLGILCGVTVWSDEQMSASFRFLGDQRFPLGRVWIVKVGMRFALAVFAAFLLLLPNLVVAATHQFQAQEGRALIERPPFFADLFHSSLVGPVVPVWTHLSMWLLYGFTAGHLCGLLFRKSLVAAVVALGSSGMLLTLWIPSLVGIGLHFWQVAGVPLAWLVAGWLLMPAWTADRLLARGTFLRLGAVVLAAALWTVGGLWYRVAEIPDVLDAFDIPAFAAAIPPMDQTKNPAGTAMHAAWHEVELMTHELIFKNERPRKPLFPRSESFRKEMSEVCVNGWPDRPSDLGERLDFWFEKDWYKHLHKVPDLPLGVVENARLQTLHMRQGRWELLGYLSEILAVRGLQMQARGDPRVFADHLRLSLALSRNVQNHAPPQRVIAGRQAELICFKALDPWLDNLPGNPVLLEQVRDILIQHEAQLPDELDALRTANLIAKNTLEQNPEGIVELEVSSRRGRPHLAPELHKAEMDLASLSWRIPWEYERHQRILRVVFEMNSSKRVQTIKWGGFVLDSLDQMARKTLDRRRATADLSAAKLKVELRLYQANNGRLPDKLLELVKARFPLGVPVDPFDGRPFRYEKSRWDADRKCNTAVLWSVGEDQQDDGGQVSGNDKAQTSAGEDLIYRVPLPRR
ncbi:MAG TPA: ABC transporter permease [Gemmataceae bacterium]|jgi:hypothetical protein